MTLTRQRRIWGMLVGLTLCLGAQRAFADDEEDYENEPARKPRVAGGGKIRPLGPTGPDTTYRGVKPDGSGETPGPKAPPAGMHFVYWPGFKARGQGAQVFLQLSGPVQHTLHARRGLVSVTLQGVSVSLRNNYRPVLTRHFPGPVSSFRLLPLGNNAVRLDIRLRRPARASVSINPSGRYHMLLVDLNASSRWSQVRGKHKRRKARREPASP